MRVALSIGPSAACSRAPSDRAILLVFVGLVIAFAHWPEAGWRGLDETVLGAGGFGAMVGLAIFIVLRGADDIALRQSDRALIAALSVPLVFPSRDLASMATTLLGLALIPRGDARLSSVGQLLVGLAFVDFWAPILLNFAAPWLLPFEAYCAELLLRPFGDYGRSGAVIAAASGHRIVVEQACSAFVNAAKAALMMLVFVKLDALVVCKRHVVMIAMSVAAMFAMNAARIALTAVSPEFHLFFHHGLGMKIMPLALLIAIAAIYWFWPRAKAAAA